MTFSLRSTAFWNWKAASWISRCGKPRSTAATMPPMASILRKYSSASASISFGQLLHEVGAAQRVGRVHHPGLVGDDLLRAQRDGDRLLGGQGQRLVQRVGVQRLRAAQHRGQRLQRRAHDVVVGLLRGQAHARGLGVEAQHPGARVLGAEALLHGARPDPARRPELGDLLEEVGVGVEEEGEARREAVHVHAPRPRTTARTRSRRAG